MAQWPVKELTGLASDSNDEAAILAQREVLILVTPARREAVTQALERFGTVSAIASPRLIVLDHSNGEVEEIRAMEGVLLASDQPVPLPLAPQELDSQEQALEEGESLFIAAWNERRSGVPKKRIGDGLPWDAEGFEPPDHPSQPDQQG